MDIPECHYDDKSEVSQETESSPCYQNIFHAYFPHWGLNQEAYASQLSPLQKKPWLIQAWFKSN